MTDYFRRLYETPADQGADAAVDDAPPVEPDVDGGGPADEPVEPTRYTMEELSEHLGPRFAERFAGAHEGPEALRKFAESYENAQTLISRGGARTAEDDALYASLGIEPPAPAPEPEQELEPMYGAPWAPPQTWEELVDLAGRNPRAAAEFALNQNDFPDETKAWFFANWAAVDAAGAFAYNQAATTKAAKEYADQQAAEIRASVEPLVHDRMVANGQLMVASARESIPGFSDNAPAVSALLAERQTRDPQYHAWFLNASLKDQLAELRDLTGVAIFRAQPAAAQQAEDDLVATEADKARSKTETSRQSGSREQRPTQQSALKKHNLEQFKKLKEQGIL